MTVHFASPGGSAGANSMGYKGKTVGIEAQAIKAIKAGTSVKPDAVGFEPMPPCPTFSAAAERAEAEAALSIASTQEIGDALIEEGFTVEEGDEPGELIWHEPVAA